VGSDREEQSAGRSVPQPHAGANRLTRKRRRARAGGPSRLAGASPELLRPDEANAEKVKEELAGTHATVIMTTLSEDAEAQLKAALAD